MFTKQTLNGYAGYGRNNRSNRNNRNNRNRQSIQMYSRSNNRNPRISRSRSRSQGRRRRSRSPRRTNKTPIRRRIKKIINPVPHNEKTLILSSHGAIRYGSPVIDISKLNINVIFYTRIGGGLDCTDKDPKSICSNPSTILLKKQTPKIYSKQIPDMFLWPLITDWNDVTKIDYPSGVEECDGEELSKTPVITFDYVEYKTELKGFNNKNIKYSHLLSDVIKTLTLTKKYTNFNLHILSCLDLPQKRVELPIYE